MAEASKVEDLKPGGHACLTFTDSEERLDLVAAFVRDGLRADQRVLCLTDAPATCAGRCDRQVAWNWPSCASSTWSPPAPSSRRR
jgi:hypothetical protein